MIPGTIEVVATAEGVLHRGDSNGELLVVAIGNARRRAAIVAETIGTALGEIVSVRESGDRRISVGPYPLSLEPVRADGFGGSAGIVMPEAPEVRATVAVTVVFRIA